MARNSMWGDLSKQGAFRTPESYLREQAEILGATTNSVLMGDVSVFKTSSGYRMALDVVVPSLAYYRRTVFTTSQGASEYPATIRDLITDRSYKCANEEEFLSVIEQVLSSPGVQKVLSTLISQAEG
jgi:hypothetical protein